MRISQHFCGWLSKLRVMGWYGNGSILLTGNVWFFSPYPIYWGSLQSIGSSPCFIRYSFALEKWRQPRKPRCADNGDGCGACRTRCFLPSMTAPFFWAYAPQSMKTTCSFSSFNTEIARSVKLSHPFPWCDAARPASTVRTLFKR